MKFGFVKCAAASPSVKVADCEFNTQQTIKEIEACADAGVSLVCFPELGLTGYTCGDLFLQKSLYDAAEKGLESIIKSSKKLDIVAVIGLPAAIGGKLYNCAAVVCKGRLLGIVPKTHLPNYKEFYEKRHFAEGFKAAAEITFAGQKTLFGTDLLFCEKNSPEFVMAVELCEDLWAPIPPAARHTLAGATVICNLSASVETVGKASYRRALVRGQSARLLCGYIYSNPGYGESSTDMTFSAHNIIAENGILLAETKPFEGGRAVSEIDLDRMRQERIKNTTYIQNSIGYTTVEFELEDKPAELAREIPALPFVPTGDADRTEACETVLRIQAEALAKRLEHTGIKSTVMGISGGLDSTLALIAAVRTYKLLDRDLKDIVAITMPCFGTTKRTRSNAQILCEALGVTFEEINIAATVESHFKDIGQDRNTFDVTFENCQARVRTLELMDYANKIDGLVLGTGNLSELALGWATYNGDHMSMYAINSGIPKTLIRHLVKYVADTAENDTLKSVLLDILDTPVSPELLPTAEDGSLKQKTETSVGPYELHDFFLYHVLHLSFSPKKIYFLACKAFEGKYDKETLLYWLKTFYRRFFTQQFKRSCMPDGPKICAVTLSPRGDWKMPSDACSRLWLKELEEI